MNSWVSIVAAQKPPSWPRGVKFKLAPGGQFYIGGDTQIRYVAYLTMVLYFIYAAIEYHVAADQQVLRLFLYGWLGHSRRAARHSAARLANSQWC